MLALAQYALKGRMQAALVISISGLLAVLFSVFIFFGWVSGGLLCLVVLRQSFTEALVVFFLSLLACVLIGLAIHEEFFKHLSFALTGLWAPVLIASYLYKKSGSLSYGILTSASIAGLVIVMFFIQYDNPAVFWKSYIEKIPELNVAQKNLGLSDQDIPVFVDTVANMMTGLLASGIFVNTAICLLIGSWWQSALYQTVTLRDAFHNLRFGKVIAGASVALFVFAMVTQSEFIISLILVVFSMYILQGLAVIHGLFAKKNLNIGWLLAIYIVILMQPKTILMVVMFGLMDAWLDFRKKL